MKEKKYRKLNVFLCIVAALIIFAVAYSAVSSWLDSRPKLDYDHSAYTGKAAEYPDAKFAVISDLHMYNESLGTAGEAFEEALYSDRKLLLDSEALLDYAIEEILGSDAEFVLIPGDLTKDGELINHEIMAGKLSRLIDAGLKVYVGPGNHDVNNPDAVSYSGDSAAPVANISDNEFTGIYKDFGYADALFRDAASLSYAAEPVSGLWLLAIDACRYKENQPGHGEIVGGKLSQETAGWIAMVLSEAQQQNKAVIAMMHHGFMEHWTGQAKLHPDYIVEDFRHIGPFLASYDVRLAFSGHYHAQDITLADYGDKYIYDVETGSLITAPCPIRYCQIAGNTFSTESEFIVDKIYPGTDFADNAMSFVKATVMNEAFNTLKKYKVSDKDAEYIADAIGDAFTAHYSGDEVLSEKPPFDKSRLGLWGRVVLAIQSYVFDGIWNDLPPGDNTASFSLN